MNAPRPRGPGRARALVFLALYGLFTLLTVGAVSSSLAHDAGRSNGVRALDVGASALMVLAGPLLGGFARDWQSCCAENSWSLLPYAAAFPALAIGAQLAPLPDGRAWPRLRLVLWGAGWFGWFATGVVSLLHALE